MGQYCANGIEFRKMPPMKLQDAARDVVDACEVEGAGITFYSGPEKEPRMWTTCRNYGAPFDDRMSREIVAALEKAPFPGFASVMAALRYYAV